MILLTYYLLLTTYSIGIGFLAPIGELANIAYAAKEIKFGCQIKKLPTIEYNFINFTRDELNINIHQLAYSITDDKIKLYKNLLLYIGLGAYYISETAKGGAEQSKGVFAYGGGIIPYKLGENKSFCPQLTYYTIPMGISITLNFTIKL